MLLPTFAVGAPLKWQTCLLPFSFHTRRKESKILFAASNTLCKMSSRYISRAMQTFSCSAAARLTRTVQDFLRPADEAAAAELTGFLQEWTHPASSNNYLVHCLWSPCAIQVPCTLPQRFLCCNPQTLNLDSQALCQERLFVSRAALQKTGHF